ncbi:hemin uptake protein HemP [uncultured Ramlibacter sp.]|uniref:hemin uptake protein HemP n=1 Tax=uncultured Ramlibacter sp. TaxID=260755 RepID=UPI002623B3EF|nr:hemin uptake protein HemP [uncultured Ramlibacter sp.]
MSPSAATLAATQPAQAGLSGAPARPVPSTELLQGSRSVDIHHNGSVYRLQATKLGKLILTK